MVMSTPKRVPAGTPASGQFAPDQHPESEVSLPPAVTADAAALSQQLNDCYDQRDDVNVHISRISARLLATQVAARYPNAATIVLDTTMSDGGNTPGVREVLDTEGTVLLDATDRLDTTVEEDDDLDEWDYTAGGIQLGRTHTKDFLDAPEWQQVGEGRVKSSRYGRLNIDKALSLR